jgi:hypothetical protein
MRKLLLRGFAFFVFLMSAVSISFGQSPPSDLKIIGCAGGVVPWEINVVIRIDAEGHGVYTQSIPDSLLSPPLNVQEFNLTENQLNQIWEAIQDNDFFNLDMVSINEDIEGRTFAWLLVIADGDTHQVYTRNIPYEPFDTIINTINEVTPNTLDLIYDISVPPEIVFVDPFATAYRKVDPSQIPEHYPEKLKTILEMGQSVPDKTSVSQNDCSNWATHGTTVGYSMSLEEAVNRGIAKLKSKGGLYGDEVSIEIDNTTSYRGDEIDVTLDLEFYGENATPENVQNIKDAIEETWNGHQTSNRSKVNVTVNTRSDPSATSPPGTQGYHQIELGNRQTSYVAGRGTAFDLNRCAGSGHWETSGDYLDETYAHEAGHLLDLPDTYQGYNKQADGTWKRESDGTILTNDQLAQEIINAYPDFDINLEDIKNQLGQDDNQRVTHPKPGHENDLMGTRFGEVQQNQIDHITADPGLVIEIEAGSVMVNKDDSEQNYVITRTRRIYVPPEGKKKLEGLFASCIDASDDVPSVGAVYDLAPHLSDWSNIESAQYLLTLVEYIDEQELFGIMNFSAIFAVWAITDYASSGDEDTQQLLTDAGINYTTLPTDFPRLSNPSPGDTNTVYLIPDELFVIETTPGNSLLDVGESITLNGTITTPSLSDLIVNQTEYLWEVIDKPDDSSAEINNPTSSSITFIPDSRGIYTLRIHVELHIEIQPTPGSGIQDAIEQVINASSTVRIVAKDDFTETFEHGSLSVSPFPWVTSGDALWSVTDKLAHTGNYSVMSGEIDSSQSTVLEIDINVPKSGTLAFTYKIIPNLYFFNFLVDDVITDVVFASEDPSEWSVTHYTLDQGEHTLKWEFTLYFTWPNLDLPSIYIDDIFFPDSSLSVDVSEKIEIQQTIPGEYKLYQNLPNPFNPVTTIFYDIPKPDRVQVHIYDLNGRLVNKLVDTNKKAGHHQVIWNGQDMSGHTVSSGVYFVRIITGEFTDSKKIMFLK